MQWEQKIVHLNYNLVTMNIENAKMLNQYCEYFMNYFDNRNKTEYATGQCFIYEADCLTCQLFSSKYVTKQEKCI